MGCGVSRIDANGLSIPVKLRPLFLSRLEEISKSRHGRPLKDSTPSKKELLFHEKDDDDYDHILKTAPSSPKDTVADGTRIEDTKRIEQENEGGVITSLGKRDDNEHEVNRKGSTKGNCKDIMKESMVEHMEAKEKDRLDNMLTDKENDDDDDDHDHIERMIGHDTDDDAFPGSPSFRVYFNDNEENDHHDSVNVENHDALKDTTSNVDTSSPKESSEKQKVKRGKKRRSFKLPKGGQVKNLLNVKSCYMPSHSAPHDRAHLLPAPKTTT